MRKVYLSLTAALVLGLGAMPAEAHVHRVSNAECAAPGAPSGATSQGSQNAPGRPDAQIPVTASEGRTQGRAEDAEAPGVNC